MGQAQPRLCHLLKSSLWQGAQYRVTKMAFSVSGHLVQSVALLALRVWQQNAGLGV